MSFMSTEEKCAKLNEFLVSISSTSEKPEYRKESLVNSFEYIESLIDLLKEKEGSINTMMFVNTGCCYYNNSDVQAERVVNDLGLCLEVLNDYAEKFFVNSYFDEEGEFFNCSYNGVFFKIGYAKSFEGYVYVKCLDNIEKNQEVIEFEKIISGEAPKQYSERYAIMQKCKDSVNAALNSGISMEWIKKYLFK